MVAGEDHGQPPDAAANDGATFELERFAWVAPDRLRLSGTFMGLGEAADAAPELVVHGQDGTHRLPALPDSVTGTPDDGQRWAAEFVWQEPPVAFDDAKLELGPDITVALPEPGTKRRWARNQTLDVRPLERPEEPALPDGNGGGPDEPLAGAERVRLEAALVTAEEEILALRATVERSDAELARAREDLVAERSRHAADAERFRQGITKVEASAAEALAAEQQTAQKLASELREALAESDAGVTELQAQLGEAREALAAKDGELTELQTRLDEADAARADAEAEASAATEALREHTAGLDDARSAAEEAYAEAERVLSRMAGIRDALVERK